MAILQSESIGRVRGDDGAFGGRWKAWIFLGAVLILGLVIYHPVRSFEFLNFDDDAFLSQNPWLKRGLDWASLQWAFTANLTGYSKSAEYWSPLTLLTRLVDAQIYGVNAGPFHVTSALLHVANSVLLCGALFHLTGRWGRSAAVALLFLVHPLNVEPVCWLSARKDLVSATFFFTTLWAYAHHVRRPGVGRYLLLLLSFCCALMAKPMGVTIPLVLLILDWWPMGRWTVAGKQRAEQIHLVAEKIPLFMFAVAGAILAVVSQHDWGAVQSSQTLSMPLRIENALVSYVLYGRRVFWPTDLAIYYPHPGRSLPLWEAVAAATFLAAVTAGAWALRRCAPFVLAGWLWFGIVLGPVIGLVQIGNQAMADRYAYPSVIGIFIIIVWGVAELLRKYERLGAFLAVGAVAILAACSMHQVRFWRDSVAAFTRAVGVTRKNDLAYLELGTAYFLKGDLARARENYLESIRLMPYQPAAWQGLGAVENNFGNDEAAIEDYWFSLKLNPTYARSLLPLGRILMQRGRKEEAVLYLQEVNRVEPLSLEPYLRLGILYAELARWDDAVKLWSAYLQIHPNDANARAALQEAAAKSANASPANTKAAKLPD